MALSSFIAVIAGLALLIWSADHFVDAAAAIATHFAVPPLLVGMVIVGFGTSAPELVVSANAALQGASSLALGNAWGSNIANVALIIGVTALVSPIVVQAVIVRKEIPIVLCATLIAGGLAIDLHISQLDGFILLAVFFAIMGWSVFAAFRQRTSDNPIEPTDNASMGLTKAWLWLIVGLLVLMGGSRLLVWGAVRIATSLGVSELIIGLTIVALGTSLPELASSITAARKGEHDLALGNVLGSNLFNALAVVGLATAIQPTAVPREALLRDYTTMLATVLLLLLMAISWKKGKPAKIQRWEGFILVALYVTYNAWVIYSVLLTS